MSMSKKDYVAIAAAVNDKYAPIFAQDNPSDQSAAVGIRVIVRAVADALQRDNPRFDRQRFLLAAIGVSV
jgi:hypothetical protein